MPKFLGKDQINAILSDDDRDERHYVLPPAGEQDSGDEGPGGGGDGEVEDPPIPRMFRDQTIEHVVRDHTGFVPAHIREDHDNAEEHQNLHTQRQRGEVRSSSDSDFFISYDTKPGSDRDSRVRMETMSETVQSMKRNRVDGGNLSSSGEEYDVLRSLKKKRLSKKSPKKVPKKGRPALTPVKSKRQNSPSSSNDDDEVPGKGIDSNEEGFDSTPQGTPQKVFLRGLGLSARSVADPSTSSESDTPARGSVGSGRGSRRGTSFSASRTPATSRSSSTLCSRRLMPPPPTPPSKEQGLNSTPRMSPDNTALRGLSQSAGAVTGPTTHSQSQTQARDLVGSGKGSGI